MQSEIKNSVGEFHRRLHKAKESQWIGRQVRRKYQGWNTQRKKENTGKTVLETIKDTEKMF